MIDQFMLDLDLTVNQVRIYQYTLVRLARIATLAWLVSLVSKLGQLGKVSTLYELRLKSVEFKIC